MPYIKLLIAIPDSCQFNITVYPADYVLFADYLIYPIPRVVFEETDGCFAYKEVYTYDTTFYEKDTIYPNKFYELNSDGHWRDQRVLEVFLYPIQFNPKNKLIYFYTGIDLRIEYSGNVVENENGLGPFEDIGREILLNYPGIDRQPGPHPPPSVHYYTDLLNTNNVADYIIVTHYDFLNNKTTKKWIGDFAQWRVDHNRFDVGIVKVQDIYDQFGPQGDSSTQLRNFLIYAYYHWQAPSIPDGHFAYCLFIGDWDYVPTNLYYHPLFHEWLVADESYFRTLTGGYRNAIMLGRWPVKETNPQDLITIAQKTIDYEKYPTLGDWRRRGLLIAGDTSGGYNVYVDSSKPYFSDIGYDTNTVRRSALNLQEFKDSVNFYLNQGEILTLFFDHGGPADWKDYDTTEVKNLINASCLPVVLSFACLTAMFQWDHPNSAPKNYPPSTCFGEHFILNPNGGTVAFWGATTYAQFYMSSVDTILKEILRNQNWILGKGLINSSNWYCLLGDPALDLGDYTAYPNLPDLVVRPQGIDISLLSPYPYPAGGDIIPIRAKVFNIGGAPAYNVDVKFEISLETGIIYDTIVTLDKIQPRDTAVAIAYWNTGSTHPNYYGAIDNCSFIVTADPNDVIEESWEYNNQSLKTEDIFLYPYEPGWPKKVTGFYQPAIANLDAEGSVEIVYPSLDSIYVFNPDGTIFSGWPQYFKDVYGIVLGDVDNNGTIDVVGVSPKWVAVYDYQGSVMTGWPKPVPIADSMRFYGFPALGYISGSRKRQVVLYVGDTLESEVEKQSGIIVYDYNGDSLYYFDEMTTCKTRSSNGVAISDVNGDGKEDMVVSYEYHRKWPDFIDSAFIQIFDRDGHINTLGWGNKESTSALADLNSDGIADVITGCRDKKIRAFDVANNQLLWEHETQGPINSSPAVGDIHPIYDGAEVSFGNDAARVHLRRGVNGLNILPWPYTITPGTFVRTSPAVANINGDKYLDIIIGADNQYLYAFKHNKDSIPPFPLPLFGGPSSPIIGDIDGDRKSEIILSSSDGYLHVWKNMASKIPAYSLEWPQFHHDYQRTGLYGWTSWGGGDANPKEFSTATTLSLSLNDNLHTRIKVYDAEGNPVKTLVNQILMPGTHHPVWYGKDNNDVLLPNGLYLIEIRVRNESKIIPVTINR